LWSPPCPHHRLLLIPLCENMMKNNNDENNKNENNERVSLLLDAASTGTGRLRPFFIFNSRLCRLFVLPETCDNFLRDCQEHQRHATTSYATAKNTIDIASAPLVTLPNRTSYCNCRCRRRRLWPRGGMVGLGRYRQRRRLWKRPPRRLGRGEEFRHCW
jgi:hypothetical protein